MVTQQHSGGRDAKEAAQDISSDDRAPNNSAPDDATSHDPRLHDAGHDGLADQGSFLEAPQPLYSGHRARLRERFRKAGGEAMPDYELLEMVLFRAIPRRDTKDLAKRLLARFGSFAEVVNASDQRLKEVGGVGEAVVTELRLVRAAALRLMRSEIVSAPVLSSWAQVLDYLRAVQGFEHREIFRVLFLDKRNKLIADEVQGQGTVDHTPVYVREVVKRALELSSTAIILVHNHPTRSIRSRWSTHKHAETLANSGIFGIA